MASDSVALAVVIGAVVGVLALVALAGVAPNFATGIVLLLIVVAVLVHGDVAIAQLDNLSIAYGQLITPSPAQH